MDIYRDVTNRLQLLGIEAPGECDPAVTYAIERAKEQILADINHTEIPNGLKYIFIEMAVGYYLYDQKAFGKLDTSSMNLTGGATEIREGDVTIKLSSEGSVSPEAQLDAMIQSMMHPPAGIMARYRRIIW